MKGSTASQPPYLKIVADIQRLIAAGSLRPGERVPSARQITRDWGVAIATATKVLAALRAEGLVQVLPGVGTVVAADAGPTPEPEPRAPRTRRSSSAEQEMSRERLVRAAVTIADAEGLTALSMRRMANELDAATMSLYQHVSSKDELIQHMVEAVIGEVAWPVPVPPGWRTKLELAARQQWAIYRRHPWLAQVMSLTRPPIGSSTLAHAEWIMGALDNLGLDANTMLHIQVTLSNYVRGTAVHLAQEAQFERDTGLTDEQWLSSKGAETAVSMVLASIPLPRFADLLTRQDIEFNIDTLFTFGLDRVLDGLGVLIDARETEKASSD
jgi:DNA-binding transcriptional regulator YhcF (GntR family)